MKGPVGDQLESHHLPDRWPDPGTTVGDGSAIQMVPKHHQQTSSWGSGTAARAYAQETAELIAAGRYRGAMAREIRDVRKVARRFGDIRYYNRALRQMLDYARSSGQLPSR